MQDHGMAMWWDLPRELDGDIVSYGRACWGDVHWLHEHTDYRPGYWEKSMRTWASSLDRMGYVGWGPMWASVLLLRDGRGTPQSGYLRLLGMGEVERSIEYAVLRERWNPIFVWFPEAQGYARDILTRSRIALPGEGS